MDRSRIACAATLLALGGACGRARGPAAPRHLLLVTLDTTRADHLGCYGKGAGVTPAIDALAGEGVVFEQALTPVPITLPAHTSLLTGAYPPHHGVHDNGTFTLSEEATTLAELLAAEGFATAAFVAARVLDRRYGLAQGFDVYEDVPRTPDDTGRFAVELPAARVVDRAIAWLDGGAGRGAAGRFFAWVHLFDPHSPYTPPPAFRERFPGDTYLAEIAYADSQVARLVEHLRRTGRLDDTLVVVTADHGEGLGEHGEETHSLLVYQPTLHVPLVMRHGSVPSGARVADPVSLVDVLPTVLGRLAVAPPSGRQVQGLDLLDPDLDDARAVRELYFETEFPLHNFGWSPLRGSLDGSLKYTWAPRPELFDLAPDPRETNNLLAARTGEADARATRLELDPEATADLEALGYASAPEGEDGSATGIDPKDRIQYAGRVINLWNTYVAGDLEKARRDAEAVLAENPRVVLAWETLGSMTMQQARELKASGQAADALFHEALEHFDRALALDPARVDALLQKGLVLRSLERPTEAAAAFERVLELQPDHAMPHRWLGLLQEAAGDGQAAARHYARFLELWTEAGRLREDTARRLGALDAGE